MSRTLTEFLFESTFYVFFLFVLLFRWRVNTIVNISSSNRKLCLKWIDNMALKLKTIPTAICLRRVHYWPDIWLIVNQTLNFVHFLCVLYWIRRSDSQTAIAFRTFSVLCVCMPSIWNRTSSQSCVMILLIFPSIFVETFLFLQPISFGLHQFVQNIEPKIYIRKIELFFLLISDSFSFSN